MSRRSIAIGAVAIVTGSILMLSLAWGLKHAALSNPPVLGRPAPQLGIKPVAGQVLRIRELQGSPVVLNFWASWCGACVEEGGVLGKAFSENYGRIRFVGADNRDTPDAYQSYGVAGLPATFFINSQGVVVASFAGPLDETTLHHYLGMLS